MAGSASVRVLVVEQDSQIRALLTDLLTRDGFQVDAVSTAHGAVTRLLENTYALVIFELILPGSSGFDLAHEIRSRGLRVPLLALSGTEDIVLEESVEQLWNVLCVRKPFGIVDIRAAIAQLLPSTPNSELVNPPDAASN